MPVQKMRPIKATEDRGLAQPQVFELFYDMLVAVDLEPPPEGLYRQPLLAREQAGPPEVEPELAIIRLKLGRFATHFDCLLVLLAFNGQAISKVGAQSRRTTLLRGVLQMHQRHHGVPLVDCMNPPGNQFLKFHVRHFSPHPLLGN